MVPLRPGCSSLISPSANVRILTTDGYVAMDKKGFVVTGASSAGGVNANHRQLFPFATRHPTFLPSAMLGLAPPSALRWPWEKAPPSCRRSTTRLSQSLAERRTKDYPLCRIGDRGCYVDRSNPNLFVMTYAPILSITIS